MRHRLWLAILVVATIAFTLVFACAAPFAAFGAAAALVGLYGLNRLGESLGLRRRAEAPVSA